MICSLSGWRTSPSMTLPKVKKESLRSEESRLLVLTLKSNNCLKFKFLFHYSLLFVCSFECMSDKIKILLFQKLFATSKAKILKFD